ncbi:bis(5'-nucleosyl)-tetraphosphatase (symmetrical) YqeK [Gordonibacter massiliensis (ex Traore et al. 2017)]|uniref:bis(5'-nucleosyl)-tetraphosphatase (symmetrical) YqeK n=1 Tax=Gordonibacter massiliensis (ex Traore et al. 2017) TaxID=1841863 RepID=UPI001FE5DE37|nr:bis(5'-nucleosyl)-tetraphosphatase (symmetrical) YqeK [Gordonibacter massiliensis (ex Traore et al. 2017)]
MSEEPRTASGVAVDVLSDAFYAAREDDLSRRLRHGRFEHALGVARTAENLARLYGADERKARLAGLLHDWDKSYDDEGIRARVEELGLVVDPYVFEEMPQLLHGPTAAAALAREFPGLPRDVVQAIERHTAGAVGMTDLDMIVYIADALEPGRDYEGLGEIRSLVGRVSLEELYLATFGHVFLNLVQRRKRIHPQTIEIWNHYIARSRDAADDRRKKKGTA